MNNLTVNQRYERHVAAIERIRQAHAEGRRVVSRIDLNLGDPAFRRAAKSYGLRPRRRTVVVLELPESLPVPKPCRRAGLTEEEKLQRKLRRAQKAGLIA